MSFENFLHSLGAAEYLDIAAAVRAGGCSIRFDSKYDVVFEHDPRKEHVMVCAEVTQVGHLGLQAKQDFFATLLQLHMFGMATNDCYFGYDPQLARVMLFRNIDLEKDVQHGIQGVEIFLNELERWQKGLTERIQQLSTSGNEPSTLIQA